MNDNVAQLQKDLDLRDKREREMKDGLIRLEERIKCPPPHKEPHVD